MTELIIIRHGQSDGNRTACFTGQTDVPLTELGRKQAQLTADHLKTTHIDAIFSSDLTRAMQTAKPIAEGHGLKITPCPELREIWAGQWEGLPLAELGNLFPEDFGRWKEDLAHCRCTGGESIAELAERVYAFCRKIADSNEGRTVCIVSHATPIRTLRCTLTGTPLTEINSFPWVTNASITVARKDDTGVFSLPVISYDKHMQGLVTALPGNV